MFKRSLWVFFAAIGTGLLLFTLVSGIIGIINTADVNRVKALDVTAEGTISTFWTEEQLYKRQTDGEYTHTVYYFGAVEYEYKGKTYTNPKISFGTTEISTGDPVTMYIDPGDPSRSYYQGEKTDLVGMIMPLVIFAAFGAAFLGAGLVMRKNGKNKNIGRQNN